MFVKQPCCFTNSCRELQSTLTPTLRVALIQKTGDPTVMSSDLKTMNQWQNVTAWRWGSYRLDPQPGHNKNTASRETACPGPEIQTYRLYQGGSRPHRHQIVVLIQYKNKRYFYFCLTLISDKTTCYPLVTSELYQTVYILQIVSVLLYVAFRVSIIILIIIIVNVLQFISGLISCYSNYFG